MTRKRMTVVRAPSTNDKAMIRIVNNLLPRAGFSIGAAIEVSYEPGIIIIKKLNKDHESTNIQKQSSVTIPSEQEETV